MAGAELHNHRQHQEQQPPQQQQQQQNGIDILCDAAAVGSSASFTDPDNLYFSALDDILPASASSPAASATTTTDSATTPSHHVVKRLKRSTTTTTKTTTSTSAENTTGSGSGAGNHICHICKRVYERADHLTRHLRSHENARPYTCTRCPKRFNRADLLTRHENTHDRDDGKGRPSIKRSDRANQACEACAAAKAKCDDQKPCGRCRAKSLVCQNPRRASVYRTYTRGGGGGGNGGEDESSASYSDAGATTVSAVVEHGIGGGPLPDNTTVTTMDEAMDEPLPPVFVPEQVVGHDASLVTPLTDDMVYFNPMHNLFQDVDFTMSWDLNLDTFPIPQLEVQGPSPQSSNTTTTPHTRSSHRVALRDPSRGHAAFKRSPWLWEPTKQEDYVRRDKEGLDVDEQSITQSPSFGRLMDRPPRKLRLTSQHRDRIFSVVLAQNKDPTKIPAFPTLDLLNYLLQAHFVHDDYQLDSWIHAPSFDTDATLPEVLAALISSGATYISVPAIWQFGLAMQEVGRVGMSFAFERNNATTRDLKALQGLMLTLDVGIWSGFKRRMEIAESFCQPLLTMLRRGGVFSTPPDALSLIPLGSDPLEVVESKWQKFITRESYKRLIIHLFTHDTQTSISLQKNPLISYTELGFSLPASRDLWRAPSAEAWRHIYLSKKPLHQPIPRVSEVMHNLNILDELQGHIDVELCYSVLLHGFWGQVNAYRETTRFYANANVHGNGGTHRLWLKSQHQELYHDLCAFSTIIHTTSYPTSRGDHNHTVHLSLTLELFLMILHVSPDEVQKFAGKAGEEEARRATASLEQHWLNTSEARYAAWHAGQVFLNARRLPPASLRGFNAIAVYMASLTLWVYGLLTYPSASSTLLTPTHDGSFSEGSNAAAQLHPSHHRNTFSGGGGGTAGQMRLSPDTSSSNNNNNNNTNHNDASLNTKAFVLLDTEESRSTKAFLQFDRGIPALTTTTTSPNSSSTDTTGEGQAAMVEPLSNPAAVLAIARGIFRDNFPVRSEPLPPLVESLGNLLRDLGSGGAGSGMGGATSRVVSRVVSRMPSEER